MQVDLTGKVALVSGSGGGIGQGIADAFAANHAIVIYSDVERGKAEAAAARSPGARAIALDVSSEEGVSSAIAQIDREFGRIDILVNNAGVNTLDHRVTIDRFPRSEWDRILAVDLTGVYLLSKAVSAVMLRQRAGRIINISSVVGLVPFRLQCAFAAAKAAVAHLTRVMAIELGDQGILVNCVAPGSILTDMTKQLFYGDDGRFKNSVKQMLDHVPLKRPGTVAEIAHAVLFLAAPESSYVNGAILTVDGGWTAGYAREF